MTDLHIRTVDGKTDERLLSLWLAAFPSDSADYVRGFLRHLPDNAITLVGECDGKPVAMLFLLASEACFRGVRYPVRYLYAGCTHSDYRGRGYYRELMNAAADIVSERKENAIFLHPADDKLTQTYQRLGYKAGIGASNSQKCATTPCRTIDAYLKQRADVIQKCSKDVVFWNVGESTLRYFVQDAVDRNAQMFIEDNATALLVDNHIIESITSHSTTVVDDRFCLWLPMDNTPLVSLMEQHGGQTGIIGD